MDLDKKTQDLVDKYRLYQRKKNKKNMSDPDPGYKPGWNCLVRLASGKYDHVALGTADLTQALEMGREAYFTPREFLAKMGKDPTVRKADHSWDKLLAEYFATLDSHHIAGTGRGSTDRVKDNIERGVRFAREFLKEKPPLDVTRADVQRYYDSLIARGTLAISSCNSYAGRVGAMLNFLRRKYGSRSHYDPGIPLHLKRVPKEHRSRKVYCSLEQISTMISSCPPTKDGMKLKFILFCGFMLGMRKNEISSSRDEWFDFKNGRVIIPGVDPKTNFSSKDRETRYIPMPAEFVEFMTKEWTRWKLFPELYMISGKRGEAKNGFIPYDFGKLFRNHRDRLGMKEVGIHTMRHSYCTVVMSQGAKLEDVAEWMGDDVDVVRDHYNHYKSQFPVMKKSFFRLVKAVAPKPKPPSATAAVGSASHTKR